jgi:hypothetical protein
MSLGSQEWGAVAVACESMGSNRLFLYVLAEHAVGAALIMLMHLRLHSLLYIYLQLHCSSSSSIAGAFKLPEFHSNRIIILEKLVHSHRKIQEKNPPVLEPCD